MAVTWHDLGKPGDPVRGNPETYDRLERQFRDVRTNVRKVNSELQAIGFGGGGFRGKAADTFADEITAVDNYLDDFGDVCQRIERIMDHHAIRLRSMRRAAGDALARAETNWYGRRKAQTDLAEADGQVRNLRDQIESLNDDDGGVQRQYLTRRCDDAEWDAKQANDRIENADDALDLERACWEDLHGDEEELSKHTSQKLRDVDLESLANPSWISQRLADLGNLDEFVMAALEKIGEAISDAMSGWLGDLLMLWYELLDVVLLVLSVVSVILAITGVGAPIAAILGSIALAISVHKLALGLTLKAFGREISWGDIAWDVFGVVTAGAAKAFKGSLKGGGLAAKHLKISTDVIVMKTFDVVGLVLDIRGIATNEHVQSGAQSISREVSNDSSLIPRTLLPFAPLPNFGFQVGQPRPWSIHEPSTGGTRCLAPTGW